MQPTPPPAPKLPPLQADMETVTNHGSSGAVTTSAKFFRDEQARTRVEHGDLVSIDDPVKGESHILNVPQKIAIPTTPKPAAPAMPTAPAMPGMPQAPTAPAAPKPPQMQEIADLGEKTINGYKVQGKRYAMPPAPAMPGAPAMPSAPQIPAKPPAPGAPPPPGTPQVPTSDVWTSKELKLPIQSSVTDPKTGNTSVTEMKNIQTGAKLDPSLFKVPPDFKIAPPPVQPPAPPYKN